MAVKRRVFVMFLSAVVGFGALLFFASRNTAKDESIHSGIDQAQVNQDLAQVNNPHLVAADKALLAAGQVSITKASVAAKSEGKPSSSGWAVAEANSARPSVELSERVSVYQVVKVERPTVMPVVGELVSFPMFSGNSVLVGVESIKHHPDGGVSWSGHLQGYGNDYPVVVTYGENSAFATITTPEGSYTMESTGGLGWLYKNPSEFELSTHGSTDVLEIPENH